MWCKGGIEVRRDKEKKLKMTSGPVSRPMDSDKLDFGARTNDGQELGRGVFSFINDATALLLSTLHFQRRLIKFAFAYRAMESSSLRVNR